MARSTAAHSTATVADTSRRRSMPGARPSGESTVSRAMTASASSVSAGVEAPNESPRAAASCTKARPTDDEAGSGTVSSARMRGEVRSPNEVGSGRPFALIHDLSAITHTSSRP